MSSSASASSLALNLVGVFDATNDLNTALDELFAASEETDSLKHSTLFPSIEQELLRMIQVAKANLVQKPSTEIIAQTLSTAESLKLVGDRAESLEFEIKEKLYTIQPRIEAIKKTEAELEELDLLAKSLRALSRTNKLKEIMKSASLPIESRAEALIEVTLLYQEIETLNSKVKLQRWLREIIEENQASIKQELEAGCSKFIKAVSWPVTDGKWDSPNVASLCRYVSLLTRLQIGLTGVSGTLEVVANEVVSELWGIQLIARQSIIRFQYHFCSDRGTNRVDRPEWFVAYILQSVREIAPFVESRLQPALAAVSTDTRSSNSSSNLYVDVLSHFIRILVKAVHQRLEQTWSVLKDDDALICHTMDEILAGDRSLAGEFGYGCNSSWSTMSGFFWGADTDKTDSWLKADLKFARQRLGEIMESKTCWQPLSHAIGPSSRVSGKGIDFGTSLLTDALDDEKDYITECGDAVMAMIDALGSRMDLCKLENPREVVIQTRFVEEVQSTLIKDFALLIIKRISVAEKCNTLLAVQESLADWKLKPRYANIARSSGNGNAIGRSLLLGKVVGSNGYPQGKGERDLDNPDASWVFRPYVDYIERLLQGEVDSESTRVFYEMTSLLKDWEKKIWTFGSTETLTASNEFGANHDASDNARGEISKELSPALSVCKSNVSTWLVQLHPIIRSKLAFTLASRLDEYVDEFVHRRMFSGSGSLQFKIDFTALCELFRPFSIMSGSSAGAKFFPRVSSTVSILALPVKELKSILSGDNVDNHIGAVSAALNVAKLRIGIAK